MGSYATDFVKDRVAVDVQFGADSSVAFELIASPMAFYVGDFIDISVEILAMKEMTTQMSSGVAYYEGALYNVLGRVAASGGPPRPDRRRPIKPGGVGTSLAAEQTDAKE